MWTVAKDQSTAALRRLIVSIERETFSSLGHIGDNVYLTSAANLDCEIMKSDESAFAAIAGTITELEEGAYEIQLAAGDVDTAGVAMLKFTADNARTHLLPIHVVTSDALHNAGVLASGGLDNVTVESGVNARQAMAIIAAALAGQVSGAGGTTVTIKAADNPGTTRISATVDANGNRSALTLTLPA